MNAIMGMTALASAHLDDHTRVADCLRKIDHASQHLLSLINDILDMNKIEHAKLALSITRVSLPDLVEQLFAMLEPQAQAADCTSSCTAPRSVTRIFMGTRCGSTRS